MLKYVFCDMSRNKGNPKSMFVLFLFRIASAIAVLKRKGNPFWIIGIPYLVFYRIVVEWLLGIELPPHTSVGRGLKIEHGHALVINDQSYIGENVTLRHSTTIGCKVDRNGFRSRSPRIDDNVDVGSNVVILGDIQIGRNAVIGAGSVVVKDIPPYAVAVGNPARVIREELHD